ncbi:MAG TPA: FAD-binding oxidoreductase, partial [Usitatibacter sp.]|nr:FAD-binding oxidoreductase [Usitatibacter sp.]
MSQVPDFGSWGGVFSPSQRIVRMPDRTAPLPLPAEGSVLPYGLGRSYGDCCLNDGNTLVRARDLDHFIAFDAASGILRCEAGVTLAEITEFALPRHFFLPVTPGTRFVTLGGAIANDVHGKNHHRAGSMGHHVMRFEVLRSDGSRTVCSAGENESLFRATIGGLGLTGLITWAEIRLQPVKSTWIRQRAMRFASLHAFFELCEPVEREHEYVVAWLDCAAAGSNRGILFAGDHARSAVPPARRPTRSMPITPPVSLVNRLTVRAFNELYYRMPRDDAPTLVPCEAFFYPLDSVHHWNRIYGPRGFFQYQCVVPEPGGRDALAGLLDRIACSGRGSFLTVLKRFGAMPPAGMMSFPRPGYTLAVDLPNQGGRTLELLESLDRIVVDAAGRVYPAKDARMSPASFHAFYPEWSAFARFVD